MRPFEVNEVSVIIINYNGEKVLREAIMSVVALDPRPMELIVLDNGSTDSSPEIIRSYAQREDIVRPIMASANLGVAGGRNLAVSYAHGRLMAFLDADGRADGSWLIEAVAAFNHYPQAGAIAPLVLTEEGRIINGAGSFLDADGHGQDAWCGEDLERHREALRRRIGEIVDYPMGCGMVIRLSGLENVWPLDERLAKWHDDSELGIRVRILGYETRFWPASVVFHIGGHSDPSSHYERHWLSEEARMRMLVKYYSWSRVAKNMLALWMHGLSGSRRRHEMWREVRRLTQNLRRYRQELVEMRREWKNMGVGSK